MYHRILVHLVWTTRDRAPLIELTSAAYLAEHLPIIARQERTRLLELGIVATHVHLLMRLHPTSQVPRLLQRLKGGTAVGINRASDSLAPDLRWAKGYGVQSVSPRSAESVALYVRHQHIRHPDEAIRGWRGWLQPKNPSSL